MNRGTKSDLIITELGHFIMFTYDSRDAIDCLLSALVLAFRD